MYEHRARIGDRIMRDVRRFTIAAFELTSLVVRGHVLTNLKSAIYGICEGTVTYPPATHDVVDVVAKRLGLRSCARANAERALGKEFRPFVILERVSKRVAIDKTSDCNHQSVAFNGEEKTIEKTYLGYQHR